jgi:hypothetical protein
MSQEPVQKSSSIFVELFIVLVVSVITFGLLQTGLFAPGHEDLKQSVSARLRDPSSAQFQNIIGDGETYCGEVNARNAWGGYNGYQHFVFHRGIVTFEPELPVQATISQQADYFDDVARFVRLQQRCHD